VSAPIAYDEGASQQDIPAGTGNNVGSRFGIRITASGLDVRSCSNETEAAIPMFDSGIHSHWHSGELILRSTIQPSCFSNSRALR
jgi:hypothetical protein